MSDTKLDYPSSNRQGGRRNSPAFGPNSKLDLPGTLADFAALGDVTVVTPAMRPFRDKLSADRTADGVNPTIVSLGSPSVGWHWLIERIVVIGGGTARAFVGGLSLPHVVDLTAVGSGDVADENSPILVNGGELVQVVFTGALVGTLCTVNMQALFVPE